MTLGGKHVLTVDHSGAEIFTGLGRFGFRRRLQWSEIRKVSIETWRSSKGHLRRHLVLEGERPYKFGGGQNDEKLQFALAFLRPLTDPGRI